MSEAPSALERLLLPVAHTPNEEDPYFAALGKFITAYASAEHQVHILARKLTGMNDKKARIVFSGMRLGDLSERIRGLLRVTPASSKRRVEIDACLRQLDIIATQRNNLVHRFVHYKDKKIVVTNIVISKSIETRELDFFDISDFAAMDSDCTAITLRLSDCCGSKMKRARSQYIRRWLREPWRYKPARPRIQTKPTRAQEIAKLLTQPPTSQTKS